MHRTLISAAVLALAALTAQPLMAAPAAAQITTQLPRSVRPTHYDVALTPDAAHATFAGKVTITLDVLAPTDTITLNAADLAFTRVALTPAAGGAPVVAQSSVDAEAQTATFRFAKPLAKGSYRLALDYTGVIGQQAVGLFSLDYDTAAGKKRALYTQFENSDARRMIPSWDEPAYKASFTLEATIPAGQMAVSNMPIAATTVLADGRSLVKFAATPNMSTYLLFFGLGEFERVTADAGGTEVGVITTKGGAAQAAFALDASKAILGEYNRYFGVHYPLPKLDNVAAPGRSQFFGAMENWGAIFTFEYAMLLDPAMSTQGDKQEVFATAAHEMAHQWFGDLVTMQWWDDLWLNEGFASWMEGRTTQKLHPEWNGALGKVGVRESAMALDGIATTHPIVQHVETVEQASQAFDSITYSKGEAVIGMLEDYVGADAWREGVRLYMKRHAYSNTVSDDLWRAVEQASGKPITEVAHQFTLQPGVPMIRVGATRCVGGNTEVALAQGEFSKDRPDKAPLAWSVPVIARTVGNPVARTLVQGGKGTLTVPGCGTLVVNAGQNGYYRTLYDAPLRDAIREDFALLEPIDQLGLLNDSQALGMAGLQPASYVLDLAGATPPTAAPEVWSEIAGQLGDLDHLFEGDAAGQARVRKFAIGRLSPVLARLGWEARPDETSSTTLLRTRLITSLSALGDPQVIAEARRRFAARDTDPAALPVALRRTVLGIVARHADAATWDALHAMAKAETTAQVRDEYYGLLARAEDPALAKRALEMAIGDEPGETNSAAMLGAVADRHPDLAFDFAMAHLAVIDPKVDTTSRSRFYPGLARGSYDPAMIAKLRAYADKHVAAKSRRATDSAIAGIETSIRMRRDRRPELDAWLRKNG
jgi:aminopeptidase N